MKNFREYWRLKKEMYERLGVTKAVAHQIWCDACEAVNEIILKKLLK